MPNLQLPASKNAFLQLFGRHTVEVLKESFMFGDRTVNDTEFTVECDPEFIPEYDGISLTEWSPNQKLTLYNLTQKTLPPVVTIQGSGGTGKTTAISEVIMNWAHQRLAPLRGRNWTSACILIMAEQNVAVDHTFAELEKIALDNRLTALRKKSLYLRCCE
jgi:hypothetical protein